MELKDWTTTHYQPGIKSYKFIVKSNKAKTHWFVITFTSESMLLDTLRPNNDVFGPFASKADAQKVAKHFRSMTKDTTSNFFKQSMKRVDAP